jgi:DNA polymerase-3 subunit epsilon
VKVTDEAFPRLSQGHSASSPGLWWLGPFRSKQAADQVTEALWAATKIRRCTGRPGSRTGECAPAQLGVSTCPCAGGIDAVDYRRMIDGIIGLAIRYPAGLLEPLEVKMRRLAAEQRFEEAAQMRDRHRALARALERQRAWRALSEAGRIELESLDGDRVIVEQGLLTAAFSHDQQPSLLKHAFLSRDALPAPSQVPPSVAVAEEAHLIWRWMTSGDVKVIDSTGPLAMPSAPIPHLRAA